MRHAFLLLLVPLVGAANPRRVADLNPETSTKSGRPNFFVTAGSRTFFQGVDAFGAELWVTDGTGIGTRRVADVNPGTASSQPNPIGAIGNEVVFAATRPDVGRELFISDGTAAGTRLLKDLEPGAASGVNINFNSEPGISSNGFVFFGGGIATDIELWRTDGTAAGTVRLADLNLTGSSNPREWATFSGRVVFTANGASGSELYATDGTAAGTTLVADLAPGLASSSPSGFTPLFSFLYFTASDPTNGSELWRWDGTTAPVRLSTIASVGTSPMQILATQTFSVYFAGDGPAGNELFRYDTVGGAVTAYDINPGPASSTPRACGEISSTVYCVLGGNDMPADVYQVSSSSSTVTPMADLNPGPRGLNGAVRYLSEPSAMLINTGGRLLSLRAFGAFTDVGLTTDQVESVGVTGGAIYVAGNDGSSGDELWTVSAFGIKRLVRDMYGVTASSLPVAITADGDRALFGANPHNLGYELFETKGTTASTRQLTSMLGLSVISSLFVLGDRLVIRFGTAMYGTDRLTLGSPDPLPSSVGAPTVFNGNLYFAASSAAAGTELWRSDGTLAGTRLAAEAATGTTSGFSSSPPLVALPTGLVTVANDGASGAEPWFSDGAQAGTRRIADLNPGAVGSNPSLLTRAGNRVFFFATTAATGTELYVTDGTTASLVADLVAGTGSLPALAAMVGTTDRVFFVSVPDVWASDGTAANTLRVAQAVTPSGALVTAGSKVFFSGVAPGMGRELWVSDGTVAGTMAIDLAPGPTDSSPANLFAVGNEVLFMANGNDGAGIELWRSDGTALGTRRVTDIAAGVPDSLPRNFGRVGSRVYFSATDLDGDEELWVYEVDTTPPVVTAMVTGTTGRNGFYTSDVTLRFVVDEPESTAVLGPGCEGTVLTDDTAGRPFSCTVTSAGGMTTVTTTLKRDVTPPVVTCPADQGVEATSPGGTMVTVTSATATDNVEATPGVDTMPRSGPFVLGATAVTHTATDGAGNAASCRHLVTVKDTKAPVPMCPADASVEGTSEAGGVVQFGVSATDDGDASPLVLVDHASGSLFPAGETTVTVTAIDHSGNAGTCTFKVTTTSKPSKGCGCTSGPGALLLAALLLVTKRRTLSPRRRVGRGEGAVER